MAEKKKVKKIRLSIPLSEEIYSMIEKDADIVGVSMATYAAMIIGNHYKTQQISLDYATNNMVEALRGIFGDALKSKGLSFDELINERQDDASEFSSEIVARTIAENNK